MGEELKLNDNNYKKISRLLFWMQLRPHHVTGGTDTAPSPWTWFWAPSSLLELPKRRERRLLYNALQGSRWCDWAAAKYYWDMSSAPREEQEEDYEEESSEQDQEQEETANDSEDDKNNWLATYTSYCKTASERNHPSKNTLISKQWQRFLSIWVERRKRGNTICNGTVWKNAWKASTKGWSQVGSWSVFASARKSKCQTNVYHWNFHRKRNQLWRDKKWNNTNDRNGSSILW